MIFYCFKLAEMKIISIRRGLIMVRVFAFVVWLFGAGLSTLVRLGWWTRRRAGGDLGGLAQLLRFV